VPFRKPDDPGVEDASEDSQDEEEQLVNSAQATKKRLHGPKWCTVQLRGAPEQLEANAKLLVQWCNAYAS
jgi:hypothetical protein